MTGRRRQMSLGEHFWWAAIAAGLVMLAVIVLGFIAQDQRVIPSVANCVTLDATHLRMTCGDPAS